MPQRPCLVYSTSGSGFAASVEAERAQARHHLYLESGQHTACAVFSSRIMVSFILDNATVWPCFRVMAVHAPADIWLVTHQW